MSISFEDLQVGQRWQSTGRLRWAVLSVWASMTGFLLLNIN